MEKNTPEQIREAFENLTFNQSRALSRLPIKEVAEKIIEKQSLNQTQKQSIMSLITLRAISLITEGRLKNEIVKELNVGETMAAGIAKDIEKVKEGIDNDRAGLDDISSSLSSEEREAMNKELEKEEQSVYDILNDINERGIK